MIVRDESDWITGCIRTAVPVISELVLVDTGSSDDTVALARHVLPISRKFRLIRHEWSNDFASARNAGLQAVSGDWILVLDADERLCVYSYDEILALTALDTDTDTDCYSFLIRNYVSEYDLTKCVTHFGPRLFRNGKGIHYRGAIHEQLVYADGSHVPSVADNALEILHYGYYASVMAERGKLNRNMCILKDSLKSNPDDIFSWFNLGVTYLTSGDLKSASDAFHTVIRTADRSDFDKPHIQASWVYLAGIMLDTGDPERAIGLCLSAPDSVHDIPDFWCVLGGAMLELGLYKESEIALNRCISMRDAVVIGISDRSCFDKAQAGLDRLNALKQRKAV